MAAIFYVICDRIFTKLIYHQLVKCKFCVNFSCFISNLKSGPRFQIIGTYKLFYNIIFTNVFK
jgi:hypothetical protein